MGRRTIILLAREVPTVVEELGEETHDEPFQGSACISCFVTEKILNRFLLYLESGQSSGPFRTSRAWALGH